MAGKEAVKLACPARARGTGTRVRPRNSRGRAGDRGAAFARCASERRAWENWRAGCGAGRRPKGPSIIHDLRRRKGAGRFWGAAPGRGRPESAALRGRRRGGRTLRVRKAGRARATTSAPVAQGDVPGNHVWPGYQATPLPAVTTHPPAPAKKPTLARRGRVGAGQVRALLFLARSRKSGGAECVDVLLEGGFGRFVFAGWRGFGAVGCWAETKKGGWWRVWVAGAVRWARRCRVSV